MRRKQTVAGHNSPAPRPAWCASFFATLALIAILGIATSAQALTIPSGGPAGNVTALASLSSEVAVVDGGRGEAVTSGGEGESEDGEEEESESEECEEDEVGDEEKDEEACKGKGGPGGGGGGGASRVCPLNTAQATVFVLSNGNKVRLQIRYSTTHPTNVSIAYGLHGGRGSLELGGAKKHFAKQGTLRLTQSLTGAQRAKVMAARGFTVRIRLLAAPPRCHPVFVRQLTVKRATPGGATWQQSG